MTRTLVSEIYPRSIAVLGFLFVVSVCAYGVGILLMVQETAYRARAEQSIRSLTGAVGELESRYLAAEESLTLERARALGYEEAKEIARVTRPGAVSLSLRNAPR